MTTITRAEKATAFERLHEDLKPGDMVRTVLRHVTSSGMTRWIDCYAIKDGDLKYLSWYVAKAVGSQVNGRHDGIKREGCGMDMGFDLVYSLSRAMFPNGFECIGAGCPSNDHSNGDRDHTPHHHSDGGYALRQRWI